MARQPRNRGGTNICFDCKKACGGCSWSRIDPATKKPAFKPVEGWKAIKVPYFIGAGSGIDSTYYVSECPLFEPENECTEKRGCGICSLCGCLLDGGEAKTRKYCYSCVPLGYTYNPSTKRIYKHWWYTHKEQQEKENQDD